MTDYYKMDGRNLSYRELWYSTRSPVFVLAALLKLLRIPAFTVLGFARPQTIEDITYGEHEIPEFARPALLKMIAELATNGFSKPFFFGARHNISPADVYLCGMVHSSGETFAIANYSRARNLTPHQIKRSVTFVTLKQAGGDIRTTSRKREADMAPDSDPLYLEQEPLAKVWAAHQHRVEKLRPQEPIRPVRNTEELRAAVLEDERQEFEDLMQRGVLVEMSAAEVADAKLAHEKHLRASGQSTSLQSEPSLPAMPVATGESTPPALPIATEPSPPTAQATVDIDNIPILEEIKNQQNASSGWGSMIFLLVLTGVLFLGLGAVAWDWKFALMLLPILFLHELGHFLAMRAFKYRNLKMFFLPLLGAVASGQHYNVPGWKKAIVSLMGPLPGIILGIGLGGAGIALELDWMLDAALMAMVINGLNLLPFQPLDGGWVVHTVLFSRHPLLDASFRVLAGLAFAGLYIATNDRIFMFLGIFTFVTLPASYKLAKVAARMRESDVERASEDSMSVPPGTANAIVNELKKEYPTGSNNKTLATLALNVFESINSKPPNFFASVALLGTHAAALAVAISMAFVLFIAKQADLGKFLDMAASAPQTPVEVDQIRSWPDTPPQHLFNDDPVTLAANFDSTSLAEAAFASTTNRIGTNGSVCLFGQSVLVLTAADADEIRSGIFDHLEESQGHVQVENSNYGMMFSINGISETNLTPVLTNRLNRYLQIASITNIVPPWLPKDLRNPNEKAQHDRARETWHEMIQSSFDLSTDLDDDLGKQIREANRRGEQNKAKELQRKLQKQREAKVAERRQQVIDSRTNQLDREIISLYQKQDELFRHYTNEVKQAELRTVQLEISKLLGALSDQKIDGFPAHLYATRGGSSDSTGPVLQINLYSPKSIFVLAPTLARWLDAHGFTRLKYQAGSPFGMLDDEEL